MESDYLEKKLKVLYTQYRSVEPPAQLIEFASAVTKTIGPVFQKKYGKDFHISMGYYYSDIKADIGYLNSCSSRNTLFYNLYLTEFITDLLFYLNHKDTLSFHYWYGKQMRHFELQNGNGEAAAFYNRLYSNAEKQINVKSEYLANAMWISVNVIFHELAHSEAEFIELMREGINDIKAHTDLSDFTKEEEIEIACDCIASMIMTSIKNKGLCTLSNDAVLGISTSVVLLLDLYRSFSEFTINKINGSSFAIKKIKEINNTLNKRTTGLMVLIAFLQKIGVLTQKSDWNVVIHYLEETGGLLDRIQRFLTDELAREIEDFNSLSEEERNEYRMVKSTKTWFYYL